MLQLYARCKKREALKSQRLKESEESDPCFSGSCTIKDMIEQSSGSGSGLPLLVCTHMWLYKLCEYASIQSYFSDENRFSFSLTFEKF